MKGGLQPAWVAEGAGGGGAWKIFKPKVTSSGLCVRKILLAATWRMGATESRQPVTVQGKDDQSRTGAGRGRAGEEFRKYLGQRIKRELLGEGGEDKGGVMTPR